MQKSVKVRFQFNPDDVNKPVIYLLSRDYNIVFSILQADIRPGRGGRTILDLTGEEDDMRRGLEFVHSENIRVSELATAVTWNDDKCLHCGMCTAVCTHQALRLDPETAELSFNNANCVVCEMCTHACPTGALFVDLLA